MDKLRKDKLIKFKPKLDKMQEKGCSTINLQATRT